jgi:ribosomal protein S8
MKELRFSFFFSKEGIKGTSPTKEISALELVKIYHSEGLINLSKGVREAQGSSQDQLKSLLPYITPYGTFLKRANKAIDHYNSNLIAFDFDHLDPHEISEIKDICRNSQSVFICVLSPKNKGIKVLALINHNFTIDNHATGIKENISKILQHLGLDNFKPDISQFTLSQGFFLCYDSEMIINLNARATNEPFNIKERTKKEVLSSNNSTFNKGRIDTYIENLLNRNISQMASSPPGSRHATILLNIKAFGMIKQYKTDLENDYFERLEKAIEIAYHEEVDDIIDQAKKTLHDVKLNAIATPLDVIENIKRDNKAIEIAYNHFIQGVKYYNDQNEGRDILEEENLIDEISVFCGTVNWSFQGYLIAQKSRINNEIKICYRGYPTHKKIDRLRSFKGVELIETKEGVLLNGEIWEGKQRTIETVPNNVIHA